MENANAKFTALEEMIAELLVNCPLASVIPLGAPPVPRDDQADLSSLRTPQNSDDKRVMISQWMIRDSQIPTQLGIQPTTGQSSTNETEQQVGVQSIVGHSSSDETGQQVPVQPNAGQSSSDETAQLSNPETQIIVHLGAARERKPSKYNLSPYCPNFSSASSSAKNISPCIYQKKHPFVENPINAPLDTSFLQEYQKWLEKDLLKSHDKKKPKKNHYR
ncbi:uncharacterized protein LOC132618665 [Lycium barbarum]|uniref:uncharacterized protein LOC132618665 n=1 Tax=Lycium barbarum TaxID=112863 RepID=UPI00293E41BC|nr:uncharacterized protein LOC132618665 [Lycium barbarum]